MGDEGGNPSTPFLFESVVYKWLSSAMDYGITEDCFWNMTLAEAIRAVESKKRIMLRETQEKASFDYILADLIGRSVARIHSSAATMPPLVEAYPTLFDNTEYEEKKQQKQDELSVIRFKQFAQAFNSKFKEVEKGE